MMIKLPEDCETFLERYGSYLKESTLRFPSCKISSKCRRLIELILSVLEDATKANADW
jgi:hypothetical protein